MYYFNNIKAKGRRRNLRSHNTPQEIILWKKLQKSQLGFKFKRQTSIGPFIVDFYCPSKKLVIELDGSQHFEEENMKYDLSRTCFLESFGCKIMRFTNTEINISIEHVTDAILKELEHNHPVPAGTPLLSQGGEETTKASSREALDSSNGDRHFQE